ncbi:hypothetical protein REC12_15510 [Desulfosporosinus sp. PR]|uniref:hypothetical protein n=1 Tax=Candidatus Desulfosporosinus nitrosoreducens TaxID=3401928 RepID=UPI0027F6D927|nr:hypothetical protein [Desulfosporosinus sp. PR]MDQ7095003.1 hypothetical protein [Desulfosporosinus sp. PR]
MDFNSFSKSELVGILNEIYDSASFMDERSKEYMEKYNLRDDICDYVKSLTYDSCAHWIFDNLVIHHQRIK